MAQEKSLAQLLYEAYARSTGWKSAVSGADLPAWIDCPPAVKAGWEAAAAQAADYFKAVIT